ncbi:glycosyltransferase family 2 protein [Actinoplanes sp. L3-i22]|uniref:glycosyltransferase family 2 protein n=1 Tax=Actinoplanes sp. L3-i22 TaxID=2836373 RepID=UPI001C747565|nr:glycosyltransferase family 2 protein [Actinoplanes sp. L3-i22]BCY09614.1 hypothetical protein L3i22_047020 [Actinoplanes sp. L3-i22]
MTLLTVIVPVHRVEDFLRPCLDSILDQACADVEVIAVDDCSPDGSGAILAGYAARDPRLRVVSLPVNVGLGPARNAGLELASGEYVWFVDSDDWLAPGALAEVAQRLRETDADVLVTGYDRVHWTGRVDPGTAGALLAAAPVTFTVEQWPRILDVLHVAWNKVVRRELLVELGLTFGPGWYEDVSFTYPILLAARRITALPRACVHYRQRETGGITRTVSDRHFEIFDHWERTWRLVDEVAPPGDAIRGLLFRRMIWHYLRVLMNASRVPAGSRARFFDRMAGHYRSYLPPGGYPPPAGGDRLRHRLVAAGSYRSLRVLNVALRWVRAARRRFRRPAPAPRLAASRPVV